MSDGVSKECFYQQDAGDYFPKWIKTKRLKTEKGKQVDHVIITRTDDIVYLANQAVITFHSWLSRVDKLKYPDKIIFDLDPPKDDFSLVKFAAHAVKDVLDDKGLKARVMTTGSVGVHVVVDINRRTKKFDQVRMQAKNIAEQAAKRNPGKLTAQFRKKNRRGRLFIDYTRNAFGQTSVVPYSLRARPGAPVAKPITWKQLSHLSSSRSHNIKNAF